MKIVEEIDRTAALGCEGDEVRVKNITPSGNVVSTLEKQMEAEREKRSEITLAQLKKNRGLIYPKGAARGD